MLIRCESNNGSDEFYIEHFIKDDYIKLEHYAKYNMPIKCYKLGWTSKGSIYLEKDLKEVCLYLNNYLHYYQIYGYLKNNEEYENIHNDCLMCGNYDRSFGCQSFYKEFKNSKCLNYEDKIYISLWDCIKNKFYK
jgi:hypothetical protein